MMTGPASGSAARLTGGLAGGLTLALIRILARQVALLVVVALAVFLLMKASPVDPVDAYLGPAMSQAGPEQRAEIAARWGLDRPAAEQFLRWAGRILQGDLGVSTSYHAPVSQVMAERLGASLALTGLAWALSGLLGFGLGLVAATFADRWPDRLIRLYCYLLAATPTFWLAILMLTLFSVQLGWTPLCCSGPIGIPPQAVGLAARLHHLLLPLLVLTCFGVAQIALHSRAKLLDVLASDYVRLARAQGAGRLDILWRHGLRNSALPALAALMAASGEIFGGSILAEQVFAWPGLGRASVEAAMKGDLPLLLAITLLATLIVSSANRIADLLARGIDPRMRAA